MPSYEDLEARVIDSGLCTVCGGCMLACPNSHVKLVDGRPRRPKRMMDCVGCSTCYDACYMLRRGLIKDIEGSVVGWGKRESIGRQRRMMAARATDRGTVEGCQDGGVVTALLLYALQQDIIDGALVVARDAWMPVARVAKDREQIIAAAGTKYGVVPILRELRSAVVEHGLGRICLVGSPCHVQSIRYLKYRGLPLATSVKLVVGLFCRENYYYHCIAQKAGDKGLSMNDIDKFDVAEEFNIFAGGRKLSFPITEVKSCVPRHCLVCEDFAAELADISIGSDGTTDGWSTVIIRTETGEKVFSGMEADGVVETKEVEDLVYIKQIAERKREKGRQTEEIFRLKEAGLGNKEIAARLGITEERVSHRLEGL